MAIVTGEFERVAETVTERAAELLGTTVTVVDQHGLVVACSDPGRDSTYLEIGEDDLCVPLHLDAECGDVVISPPTNGEAISPRLCRVMAELIINQATVVDRLPNKHELKNKFIHDLLHNSAADEATILREAQILGMNLAAPRLVILIDAADYILGSRQGEPSEQRIRRRSQLVIGSVVDFFELPNDTICAYIGQGEVAVLKASNTKDLLSWIERPVESLGPSWANLAALKRAGFALLHRLRADTRSDISIGIGRYHAGIDGLARSYQDARVALSLGRRFHGQNQVHCLDGLGIAGFVGVSDERTKIDLATFLLSPLDHEPELLQTLEMFFAHDCSPCATAAALTIHRNTLSYRLDKIASLTGLDPRRFDDAVQIRLALVLRALPTDPRDCATA
ncbi:MAG TPA: helix-turn-helix domain-containing protein [Chloroflexota bacterium]|nr:helix-turn-helix domain-containing protein [Chloroflexota bacterium]